MKTIQHSSNMKYEYILYFSDQHGAKWPESWAFFINWQMFAVLRLRYLRQYIIQVKLRYIFELLTSSRIHTYVTHIYHGSIKTWNDRQIAEPYICYTYISWFYEDLKWLSNSGTNQITTEMSVFLLCQTFDLQI